MAPPLPIETAPHGQVVLARYADTDRRVWSMTRDAYNRGGATHWLPSPPPPEDPAWEEARLERAVVDAALAAEEARVKGWAHDWSAGHAAIDALRVQRAKKGGG